MSRPKLPSKECVEALTKYQQQADDTGELCTVSRQAVDEVCKYIEAVRAEQEKPETFKEVSGFIYMDQDRKIIKPCPHGVVTGWCVTCGDVNKGCTAIFYAQA